METLFRKKKPPLCLTIARPADALPLFPDSGNRKNIRNVDAPFAWRRRDDAAWQEFLRAPLACDGVLVQLSAAWFAEADDDALRKKARLLGSRLADLRRAADARVPVFLLIDGIDRLYGWRTLAGMLPRERLARPLGGFCGGSVDRLLDSVADEAARLVCAAVLPGGASRFVSPARLQAAPELLRVVNRLRVFTKRLAGEGGFGGGAPEGMFFCSSLPGLPGVPPFAVAPSFVPAGEEETAAGSLFLEDFVERILPSALRRRADRTGGTEGHARRRRGVLFHAAAAVALASLLLCGMLTSSFAQARGVLLSAAGAAAHPRHPDDLAAYLRLAETAEGKSAGRLLPRFGMVEDAVLADELKARFTEGYFDLKTVPGIDRLQNAALDAVRTGSPQALGNALLMLVLVVDRLDAALGRQTMPEDRRMLLTDAGIALALTDEEEMRQLGAFFRWAGARDWMPEVRDGLARFVRHILRADALGSWMPAWAGAVLRSVDGGAEEENTDEPGVEWSWRAQAVADELAAATEHAAASELTPPAGLPKFRDAVRGEYRRRALAAWTGAAAALWNAVPRGIPDAEIPGRLREAAAGRDPALRFAARAGENLFPLFDPLFDENGGGALPPEIRWLRARLDAAEQNAALADAFGMTGAGFGTDAEAERLAREETERLAEAAGAAVWPSLAPAAVEKYVRHLRAREAALLLDGVWLRSVYSPVRLTPGGEDARRERLAKAGGLLETFLTGPADGCWAWENDRLENARKGGVAFSFSREFLDFCNTMLALGRLPAADGAVLEFRVDSVSVTGGRVLERPAAVEFRLGADEEAGVVRYRNYPVSGKWMWTPAVRGAEIRLVFPSHTAVLAFSGKEGCLRRSASATPRPFCAGSAWRG